MVLPQVDQRLVGTNARTARVPPSFWEDSRLNVYAGELEVRPPGAPTTTADQVLLRRLLDAAD